MKPDIAIAPMTFDDGPKTAIHTAQNIMGQHFVGIEGIEGLLSIAPSDRERTYLYNGIPFRQDTLRLCAGTHFLLPYIPTPIDFLRNKYPELFEVCDMRTHGIEIDNGGPLEWHLVERSVILHTQGYPWDVQRRRVLDRSWRTIIPADVLVFALVAYRRLHREFLYTEGFRRTSTFDSYGSRLAVGVFDGRISITSYGDGLALPSLSVATGIKTGA